MIQSHVIQVVGNDPLQAENRLGEAFNAWMQANPCCRVVHFFEPVRHDASFNIGPQAYGLYHTSMTFFYEDALPYSLKELPR